MDWRRRRAPAGGEDVAVVQAGISPNKVVGDLLVASLLLLLNLLLAGHGGWGKKVGGRAASSPGGGRGGVPAVVLRRGTTRSLEGSFVKIPSRKMAFCGWMVSSLNKKRLYRLLITVFVVLLLAGRGGDGEVGTGLTVAGFGRWRPCTLCLVKHNEFLMIQVLRSGCYASEPLQAAVHGVVRVVAPETGESVPEVAPQIQRRRYLCIEPGDAPS